MAAAKLDGKAGFVSAAGKWLIEPKFDRTLSFVHDLAAVELGETYRYSQRDGQIVWTSRPWASLQYPPEPLFVWQLGVRWGNPGRTCTSQPMGVVRILGQRQHHPQQKSPNSW
jgi:hypothetical protein